MQIKKKKHKERYRKENKCRKTGIIMFQKRIIKKWKGIIKNEEEL